MAAPDVVVTGIGMVTPLGATAPESGAAWRAGRGARRRRLPELAGTPLENDEVAVLPDFDPAERLGGRRMLKYMSAAAVLGCVAAREASTDAGLRRRFRPERVGVYAGTGLAAASVDEAMPMLRESIDTEGRFSTRLLGERGLAATNPLLSFRILANMPPCLVSILEGARGANLIFTPWEGQTGAALQEAWRAVADGEVDAALAGGADNAACPATLVYLRRHGLLGDGECAAAGAAYLVVERAESAARDGQRAYARVASIELTACEGAARDPLAPRLGRTFAAAPAILVALACQAPGGEVSIRGVDRQEFRAEVTQPS